MTPLSRPLGKDERPECRRCRGDIPRAKCGLTEDKPGVGSEDTEVDIDEQALGGL